MLKKTVKEMLDSVLDMKKSMRAFYDRALAFNNLHPNARSAFEAVQALDRSVGEKVERLRAMPLLSGPDGEKSASIEFVLEPVRNRILPPDSELNVYVRALEYHKRCHELLSRFAAAPGAEPLKKDLEALAAIEISIRNELQRRFDEWDASAYGETSATA